MAIKHMLQRRGTPAEWTSANPILGDGEIGFVKNTASFKIGDGVTAWNLLPLATVDLADLDARYIAIGNAVGARLATASLPTGLSLTALDATLVDLSGLTISPVIGSRGVDLEVSLPIMQGSTGTTIIVAVIDVTAGNVQIGQGVAIVPAGGAFADSFYLKVDHAPAAGTRTYKVQAKAIGGTADVSFYGDNTGTRPGFLCTQR